MTVEVYVDSSALRQLYAHEARSAAMAAWRFRNPGALALTRFGRAELMNAMASAVFRGDITSSIFESFVKALEGDIEQGRLILADVAWRTVLDRTAELSRQHTPQIGTRSLDVLHVASALELGARRFVTYDVRQARLATACGLKTVAP